MVTIHELEKLGTLRNVYEDALELSFGAKNPGKIIVTSLRVKAKRHTKIFTTQGLFQFSLHCL